MADNAKKLMEDAANMASPTPKPKKWDVSKKKAQDMGFTPEGIAKKPDYWENLKKGLGL